MGKGLIFTAVAGVFGLVVFVLYDSFNTHERAGQQQQEIRQQENTIKAWQLQVDTLNALNKSLTAQIKSLQEKNQDAHEYFDDRDTAAGELATSKNGAAVTQWRAAAVPDDIRRLYESPACANAAAADCYKRVPTGGAVPEAGDQNGQ